MTIPVTGLRPPSISLCRGHRLFTLSFLLCLAGAGWCGAADSTGPALAKSASAAEFFRLTNVHTAHFKFAAEQWETMEPKGGPPGLFGGAPGNRPGGGAPGRGPGGPGGQGPMAFGPGNLLAPAMVKNGDRNADAKLTSEEMKQLSQQWFDQWDKEKSGQLKEEQVAAGLNGVIEPPRFGPPGGGPGRGPGLFLQGQEGKRNGLASAMGIEFPTVRGDLDLSGLSLPDVAVRFKGNGTFLMSRGSEKRSLKVDLNEFIKGQKIGEVAKLNFHNNTTDASFMNEVLSHRLYRDAGVPAPRTAYARLLLTVPGKHEKKYLGIYSLVENVDNNFAEEHFKSKKGVLLKPVTPAPFTDLGSEWSQYQQTYDPKTEMTRAQQQRLIDFCQLVSKASDADFDARLGQFLDLEAFARYMAVTVWLSTLDSLLSVGQNYYVYLHPQTQKFQFIPWDLDHSFGQFNLMGTQEQREKLDIHRPWSGENKFLTRVFQVAAFKKPYLARLEEFNQTLFQPARLQKQVDELAKVLHAPVTEEGEETLARFEKTVAGEGVLHTAFGGGRGQSDRPGAGGPPGPFGNMQPAKPIRSFVEPRWKSVADQLAGKAKGESVGGFGFGGPGRGAGGPPGGGAAGGGGNRLQGPAAFLAPTLTRSLDADKNGSITREEFSSAFSQWHAQWDPEKSGALNEQQLVGGLNRLLAPNPPGGGNAPAPTQP